MAQIPLSELTLRIAERANRIAEHQPLAPGAELELWQRASAEVKRDFAPAVEELAEALRAHHPGVARCEARLEERVPRAYERKRYNVRLELDLPGRHLVVNREHEDDPLAALDDAFAGARLALG